MFAMRAQKNTVDVGDVSVWDKVLADETECEHVHCPNGHLHQAANLVRGIH